MKTEEKKTTVKASAASKKAGSAVKSAAKTTAAKKAPAKTSKTAAKKPAAAKKTVRKTKPVTIDKICELLNKKISGEKAAKIKETIAVDIEVWGFEDGSNRKMYVEVMDGKVSVMPHSYDAKNFRVSLSFANAMNFVNGKTTLAELLKSKDFYAEGDIVSAIKLSAIF